MNHYRESKEYYYALETIPHLVSIGCRGLADKIRHYIDSDFWKEPVTTINEWEFEQEWKDPHFGKVQTFNVSVTWERKPILK
jgi:hypothetical protein